MSHFTFRYQYLLLFIFLFIIEVLIAKFLQDAFIRPFVGDVLVVILIYSFLKSFLTIPSPQIAAVVLIFSCLIEFMQLFHLVKLLHLQNNAIMRTALGSVFDYKDIFAYLLGYLTCLKIK